MLFNSLTFLLLFLPLALVGFYSLARIGNRWAAVWLVGVSFLFYSWWSSSLVFLLGGSIAFNFTCGALILRAQSKERLQSVLLFFAICGDLLLLFYYKYLFSILNWLGFHGLISIPHPYNVILPLGLSFFTFTQIGYLVDCRGGIVKTNRFLDYCLFVTFFPHLIAGPILHHREMMPQFADPKTYLFRWENLAVGSALFLIGLTKKVVIADCFISTVSSTFSDVHGLGFFPAWDGAISYSLQLYFDFSGYSDMACGLAILFGLRFPANFNSPYRATNMIDYWQRFHMTLTRYITLYVFSPIALYISRRRMAKGLPVSRKAISTPSGFFSLIAFPTLFTMILAGIWHGAGLTFLVFGLLHAAYLITNHAWRSFGPRVPESPPHPFLRFAANVGKVGLTYLAVVVAQVFFRSPTVHDALRLLAGMAGNYGIWGPAPAVEPGADLSPEWARVTALTHKIVIVVLFFIIWTMPNSLQLLGKYQPTLSEIRQDSPISFECRPTALWAIVFGLVAALALLEATGMTEFLYFRF